MDKIAMQKLYKVQTDMSMLISWLTISLIEEEDSVAFMTSFLPLKILLILFNVITAMTWLIDTAALFSSIGENEVDACRIDLKMTILRFIYLRRGLCYHTIISSYLIFPHFLETHHQFSTSHLEKSIGI